MLNSNRLIYILPDVSYIAELLPGKKDHSFSVQSFRQVNGEFMKDENIAPENISKLFSKLDAEEYRVILPDFLFTNTIVDVPETTESKIKAHITEKVLPKLDISDKTHLISFFTLTSRKGISSVQISAIEHETLAPIKAAAEQSGTVITAISPLTWTIKAVISLEPSVSVLQLGTHIFVAKHYIGVDQASFYPSDAIDDVIQAITALKGAEASIQTVYVMSNELIETKLKEGLSSVIPIQQLAPHTESTSELPAHVQEVLEQSMRTLDIPDFPVPSFKLDTIDASQLPTAPLTNPETVTEKEGNEAMSKKEKKEAEEKEKEDSVEEEKTSIAVETEDMSIDEEDGDQAENLAKETDEKPVEEPEIDKDTPKESDFVSSGSADLPKPIVVPAQVTVPEVKAAPELPLTTISSPEPEQSKPLEDASSSETATLEKFVSHNQMENSVVSSASLPMSTPTIAPEQKEVIKNPSATGTMVKMVFITISVLFLTVAVGVGLGLGFLNWQQSNNQAAVPVAASPSPVAIAPSPSPIASPSATVDKEKVKLLVVNATTTAGKAGVIKKALEADGFGDVTAGNAKGTYKEAGTFVLMKEEDSALVSAIGTALKLDATFAEGITAEDPKGSYTAVVVINE